MIFKLTKATIITMALYLLVGFNAVETKANAGKTIEPPDALIALKQAITNR
ncbi:MAG: hypothetical protein WA947_21690 [Phormidesmis sp.]